jgi:hypothetical protein
VADKVNKPASVDVTYAHGALTHTYGHGIEIYEALALNLFGDPKVYEANVAKIAASRLRDNDAYYIVDTEEDLETKWPRILDGKPDFIKIFLLTSEDYPEKLKNIPRIPLGSIGLDPKLVPSIVQRAHAAGLRVSAHVDTVTDYRVALSAGVDEMAHVPGYLFGPDQNLEKYLLTEEDATRTARRGVWVVPCPVVYQGFDAKMLERIDLVRRRNLQLLKKHQVKIAFGSDSYGSTPVNSVIYLNRSGVFSNLESLKIWSEMTPQMIFRDRKIGYLKEGYEASFLVLGGDPIQDFAQVKNIKMRFKQGHPIM